MPLTVTCNFKCLVPFDGRKKYARPGDMLTFSDIDSYDIKRYPFLKHFDPSVDIFEGFEVEESSEEAEVFEGFWSRSKR